MNITVKINHNIHLAFSGTKTFLQSDLTRDAGVAQATEVLQQAVQNVWQPMFDSSTSPGVRIDGIAVYNLSPCKKSMSTFFQQSQLFTGTVFILHH